jgi:hypothetical protein
MVEKKNPSGSMHQHPPLIELATRFETEEQCIAHL